MTFGILSTLYHTHNFELIHSIQYSFMDCVCGYDAVLVLTPSLPCRVDDRRRLGKISPEITKRRKIGSADGNGFL